MIANSELDIVNFPTRTKDCVNPNHDQRNEDHSSIQDNSLERTEFPQSPNYSQSSQSHVEAIISSITNIMKPEKHQLNNSFVLPSPVSNHHRSSVQYDYGINNIEYGDYFVPLVQFESGVDAACNVDREVQNKETQTGVISALTQKLAKYRKYKEGSRGTDKNICNENISLSLAEQENDHKISQEVPINTAKEDINCGIGGKHDQNELKLERKFACWTCGNSYKKKSHLERHIRKHTGERPFSCPDCEKKFAARSVLQQHIRTHTGEKPYCCKICQQSFPQKSGLLTHTMLHTGKPFKCNYCSKGFVSNNKLLLHLQCHTGDLRNTCRICNAKFYTTGALKQHSQTHAEV